LQDRFQGCSSLPPHAWRDPFPTGIENMIIR
jgi:hypothetical protein